MTNAGDNNLENDETLELVFRKIKEVEEEVASIRTIIELTQMLVLELKMELKSLKEKL